MRNNQTTAGRRDISPGSNVVYLNKVFFDDTNTSCPILFNLTTLPEAFTRQITFSPLQDRCGCEERDRDRGCGCRGCGCDCGSCGCGCGSCGCGSCGCCDFTLTEDTTFQVEDSRITVTGFALSPSARFDAGDVTIDGFPVTELNLINGQYVADLSGIMDEITRCPDRKDRRSCSCHSDDRCRMDCDNDGHFFLAQVPGPWILSAAIILEGTASNGSRTCHFRACFKTRPGSGISGITIPGSDNFAINCVEIPCQAAGISPTLVFDFDACASLLNPRLTAVCTEDACTLRLNATLVLTPDIRLQVTRPARFMINAREIELRCDNVGQCDPCREDCCCDHEESEATRPAADCNDHGCSTCNAWAPACQCCDTNGYTF